MSIYTVKLMTVSGEVDYSDYHAEKATFNDNGNSKDILFIPYNGRDPSFITSVILDDGDGNSITIPANFRLDVGNVVKFPKGTLKETDAQATPLILSGAPYLAMVRLRQAFLELTGDKHYTPSKSYQSLKTRLPPFICFRQRVSRNHSPKRGTATTGCITITVPLKLLRFAHLTTLRHISKTFFMRSIQLRGNSGSLITTVLLTAQAISRIAHL